MTTPPVVTGDLDVGRRRWLRWLWIPVLAVVVASAWWWAFHPSDLSSSGRTIEARVKAGQTVYLGVPAGDDKARTVTIHSITISAPGAEVSTWVCHDGAIAQTTRPEPFCKKWTGAKNAKLAIGGGDQLVIGVTSDTPGVVEVGRAHLDFSDGLQRGSSDFGPTYRVEFLG